MIKQTVDRFTGQMLGALMHAGPRPGKVENNSRAGWIDDTPGELWILLGKYRERLANALIDTDENTALAVKQCVNVANAAMMLADVLERRQAAREQARQDEAR